MSEQQKRKSLAERLDDLEKNLAPAIFEAVNRRLASVTQGLHAVVEILGKETVANKVKELTEAQMTEELTKVQKQLEDLKAQQLLVKSELVKPGTVLVGRELNLEGVVAHPGQAILEFGQFNPQFQERLLGKAPGATVEVPNLGKFELQEVWEFVPPPQPAAVVEAVEPQTQPQPATV